ncbi:MAG TPA: hypothetical protein VJQ46_01125 [Gemmatimonadales bacterium]|nr:hypothetical protein [Gemmatimonadales bacterium]
MVRSDVLSRRNHRLRRELFRPRPRLVLLRARLRLLLFRARLVLARFRVEPPALRLRVAAAFRADADRAALLRRAEARPPSRPPFFAGLLLVLRPRPEPDFLPPPDIAFSVAQARRSASDRGTPRRS